MAITTIRTTYALDVPTVRALDDLAQHWQISKSETLRRLILSAAKEQLSNRHANPRLEALRALQNRARNNQPELPSPASISSLALRPERVKPVNEPVPPVTSPDAPQGQLDSWLL